MVFLDDMDCGNPKCRRFIDGFIKPQSRYICFNHGNPCPRPDDVCSLRREKLLENGMEVTTLRRADEGDGPHERLILRGATIIDGTGAPPMGPVDIVIEGDRIVEVKPVGFPMAPIAR